MHGEIRFTPRSELIEFEVRCIVAGTRHYNNYRFFCETMDSHVAKYFAGKRVCFISGKAKTGADDMVIRWCVERGYPVSAFPADWDLYGKRAGYIRNAEMAKDATELVTFYDGVSKGTRHMIETAIKGGIEPVTYIIDIERDKTDVQSQPQSSRSSYPSVGRETVAW